ncbi:hypothetical protein [Micromonospora fulviviridis]|uniref:hypothetical protein n=1 Tax=Micromonospora fulviviridis TaxID=47860 RepID=UPI003792F635
MSFWQTLESLGTVTAAGIAAVAAFQSRSSAREANSSARQSSATATELAAIEKQRRHNELCPRLRVLCEPLNPGSETLRMRVLLTGPPGLDRIDRLTVTIRNDNYRRGEDHQQIMDGPTEEEVKQQIWGPYRFSAAPAGVRPTQGGREVVYAAELPLGEELPYQLEHTYPGRWMTGKTQSDWLRERGNLMRLAFTAEHADYGTWYLPCEIDTASVPTSVYVPQ